MNITLTQFFAAIIMAGVAFALLVMYRRYLANASERRMSAMLERVGIDPAIASSGDKASIIREIRQRCRHCSTEDVCERWLADQEGGDNDFCPNAKVFEALKQ